MLGKVWLGLVVASLATLLICAIKQRKGLIFWIPVVVILGSRGLLIWVAAERKRRAGNWQAILVEAAGDVTHLCLVKWHRLASASSESDGA